MILRYPSAAGCHGGLEARWGDGTGFSCVKLTVETEFSGSQKESRAVRKLLPWLTQEKVLAWSRTTAKTGLTDAPVLAALNHTAPRHAGGCGRHMPTRSPSPQLHRARQTRGRPASARLCRQQARAPPAS